MSLEQRLDYRFKEADLLQRALTHQGKSLEGNERLEFLGDAVLGCVVAEHVYTRFPSLREGELHRMLESLVREETLAEVGRGLSLEEALTPALATVRASTLADTVEALFGAIFLDGGYAAARKSILHVLGAQLAALDPAHLERDAKSRLQERIQARFRAVPEYRMLGSQGAAHERLFEVECRVPQLELTSTGSGSSRQRAEQAAAAAMLQQMDAQ